MTRGSKMKLVLSWKKVANFFETKALVFQLYMTMTSLLTCTIHCELVAMSPPGGKRLPPVVCVSLVLPICVYSVTLGLMGGAAPGFACPGARAAAAFLAAI